jgi:hypothetical protein
MSTLEIVVLIQSLVLAGGPLVCNLAAWILRVTNHPTAAAWVERMLPFALRLGMAKTAKDIIETATDLAHTVTTQPPTSAVGVTSGSTAIVTVDVDPTAPKPGAAPKESIVLPLAGGMLFALVAFGCGGLPPEVAKGVEDISQGVSKADEGSRELYAFALSLCPDDACQAKLERLADPMIDGFQAIRVAWCAIKPDAEGCDEPTGGAR